MAVGAMEWGLNHPTRHIVLSCPFDLLLTSALDQAFTYTGGSGPLVLIARSGWIDHGLGSGQTCLSAQQGSLQTVNCDPSTPASQQQFFVGPP